MGRPDRRRGTDPIEKRSRRSENCQRNKLKATTNEHVADDDDDVSVVANNVTNEKEAGGRERGRDSREGSGQRQAAGEGGGAGRKKEL